MSSIFKDPPQHIRFHNDSDLPIQVCAWIKDSNIMSSLTVRPGKNVLLHSSVGEWHLDSMFNDDDDCRVWKEKGLGKYLIVGKFRSSPSAMNEYSWMEYGIFDCVYTEIEDEKEKVKGLVTFTVSKN